MKIVRSALPLALLAALCVSLSSCAAYRHEDKNLTLQTGSGAQLNVPWFVRGFQDWVNDDRP
jgi:hypothetical protein